MLQQSCAIAYCLCRAFSAMVAVSKHARPAPVKTPASATLGGSAIRTKDALKPKQYMELVRKYVLRFTNAYKASNQDLVADSYEKLLHALILATPRVSKPHLHAAAINVFHVSYSDADLFAQAIYSMFMAITKKTRKVTSGTRQDAAVLRLIKTYKVTWGSDQFESAMSEEEGDAPADPSPSAAGGSSPPAPTWALFTTRFGEHAKVICILPICNLPIALCTFPI